ncbi:MAG: transglutaminase-like domain-containing protein [Alphaproteobacteria bacterium]|nr:transglutaminase-like domain-containing protein [Alphaproteobacteria bacterium]
MREDDPTLEDLHVFETPDEAFQYVRYAGTLDDADIDMGETSLALGLLFLPGIRPERYRHHLRKLAEALAEDHAQRLKQGEKDGAALRLACLRRVIHEQQGYAGDGENYDDLQNANMIRVIERRRGLPVALGLLYIIAGRKCGWQIDGLNFPGHFLLRLEMEGERLIADPFRAGVEMDAASLRVLLKSIAGQKAELSHQFYVPVSNRDMLLRLQNNLKKRLIEQEEYAQAVIVLEAMEALAPDEYRTSFDKGVLYAKLGQKRQAMQALEDYIIRAPDARDRQQAQGILAQIRQLPD